MASKYRTRYTVPDEFPGILMEFIREVLREQPVDILTFAHNYFKSKNQSIPFAYEGDRRQPLPCDYGKRSAQSGISEYEEGLD